MTSFHSSSSPTQLPEDAITRPWPNRWSISREGLEVVVNVLRRKNADEQAALRRELLDAFELQGPQSAIES